ncbi:hypothetical protein ElyMa_002207300 [Elysia marginata]|uniref:Uncharacterized protein n=1 Tax=Elysia marginata TaxID=1093978 RepID=A0AAV4FT56_9GAST|nr:hypothetical protein ElyMa_002207300 [Elysia marginata]
MVGNRTHDLQISATLSHVSPKGLTFFAPDITDDISGLVYRIGFLGLLSLFKEVNELNTKYSCLPDISSSHNHFQEYPEEMANQASCWDRHGRRQEAGNCPVWN